MMNRRTALTLATIFLVLAMSPTTLSQVPPNGEHSYGGTQDDTLSGDFTGSVDLDNCPNLGNQGCMSGNIKGNLTGPTEVRVREYTLEMFTNPNSAGVNRQVTPLDLGGDINTTASMTHIEVFVFTGSTNSGAFTDYNVRWFIDGSSLASVSSCTTNRAHVFIAAGGVGGGAGGAGESRLTCTMNHQSAPFTVTTIIDANANTQAPRQGFIVTQTEIYNYTPTFTTTRNLEITDLRDLGGSITGTWTGTSNGTHRGEIEQINATSNNNQTSVENLTATNFTFANIFGSIQIEEIDFWFPILFWLFVMLMAWGRGWILTGFIALAGFLVEFAPPDQQEWTRITSLILLVLSFSLEFAVEKFRLRKDKEQQMV